MKKKIYQSASLRMVIKKKGNEITLHIEERSKLLLIFYSWDTVDRLSIKLESFWTITGEQRTRPIRLIDGLGGVTEIWYPNVFDLNKRMEGMWTKYFERNKSALLSKYAASKQFNSIQ